MSNAVCVKEPRPEAEAYGGTRSTSRALKPPGHPPLTGVMVVRFGCAFALVYAIDCGFASSQLAACP